MTKNQIFRNLELIGMIIVNFVLLIFVLYTIKYVTDLFYIYDIPNHYWFLSLLAFSIPMSTVFEAFEITYRVYLISNRMTELEKKIHDNSNRMTELEKTIHDNSI